MLKDEARWLSARLQNLSSNDGPLLNVGSSSAHFREQVQPWIHEWVFAPLEQRLVPVIHQDLFAAPGVDVAGDLLDSTCQDRLQSLGVRSILSTSLLEHVVDRAQIARIMSDLLPSGGRLLITVPHAFPYHPDPIDTLFRPTCDELIALFPDLTVTDAQLVDCGRLHRLVLSNPGRAMEKLVGLLPFGPRPHADPVTDVDPSNPKTDGPSMGVWLPWIVKPFVMCCLDLVKP